MQDKAPERGIVLLSSHTVDDQDAAEAAVVQGTRLRDYLPAGSLCGRLEYSQPLRGSLPSLSARAAEEAETEYSLPI